MLIKQVYTSSAVNMSCELSALHITQMLGTMNDFSEEGKKKKDALKILPILRKSALIDTQSILILA